MAGVNIAIIGAMFTPVHFEALVMKYTHLKPELIP